MAASIRARPLLSKTLYLSGYRNSCRQCQSSTGATVAEEVAEVGRLPVESGHTRIPRGQIEIPKRKKRDSLSILKALASTVGKDPSGPQYAFIDDPQLIPVGRQKKFCLMSKGSGKRAARYIINEFRNTFDHDAAKPHIPAFMPDEHTEYKHTEPCPEALEERISRREVKDAIEVYSRLTEEGHTVSAELKLAFLELLCVFGCKDPEPKLFMEEKLVKSELEDRPDRISMNLAEEVFQSLPEKTEDAYNWIVRGYSKAGVFKGMMYYDEMKGLKIPVHLGTYNSLIDIVARISRDKWNHILKYLKEMKSNAIAPNLETFNSLFRAMSMKQGRTKESLKGNVPSVLAEMKLLQIEPTLYTWSLVLGALQMPIDRNDHQSIGNRHSMMADIIDIIKYVREDLDKVQTGHSEENFLYTAMRECQKTRDSEVAIELFELKEDLGYRFVVTSLADEHFFHDTLLKVVSEAENTEVMMDVYSKVCPSQHFPSTGCLAAVLANIDMYREYQHVLQIWEDSNITQLQYANFKVLTSFLDMFGIEHVPDELGAHFVKIAESLYDQRMALESINRFEDDEFFSKLATIFVSRKHLDYAWKVTMHFFKEGFRKSFRKGTLNNLFALCIQEKDVHKIMSFCDLPKDVTSYMINPDLITQNRDVLEELLDQSQLEQLDELCY